MRLDGISSIAEANTFLDSYMARHNARFARPAFDARDLHRPLAPHDDLRSIMDWREQRTVTAALTLHYNKAMLILESHAVSTKQIGRAYVWTQATNAHLVCSLMLVKQKSTIHRESDAT